jgi:aspartate racemase
MKAIGVLGGLGPQATMEFEARVHRAAQELIPQRFNSGYPPMVVYYCRFGPFVATDSGAPELPLRPRPELLEAAATIGGIADFVVIVSNFIHLFRAEIEDAAGRRGGEHDRRDAGGGPPTRVAARRCAGFR